jgi:serine/threonine protein kinase
MPDFGTRWLNAEKLRKGGQAQTFVVSDAENPTGPRRVAKILDNPKEDRKERFLREIEVTESFSHPNLVRSLGRGETVGSKWPYFIMPLYDRGTLEENYANLGTPIDRLRVFLAICEGVAHAHSRGLVHRDLKPANIFMAYDSVPVVGDFGLCYRAEEDQTGRNTQTSEAVGARKYMPPEWREGRAENPQATGDVYSLGKILYWMFQNHVFDGHEDDHSAEHPIIETSPSLHNQTPQDPQFWTLANSVASKLVGRTVRKRPEDRISTAEILIAQIKRAIERVESGGRVLDFNLPKRCLFCGEGTYVLPPNHPFPARAERRNPTGVANGEWPFRRVQEFVNGLLGFGRAAAGPIPICLVCSVCGNIQYFRLDLTTDKSGQKWNP